MIGFIFVIINIFLYCVNIPSRISLLVYIMNTLNKYKFSIYKAAKIIAEHSETKTL